VVGTVERRLSLGVIHGANKQAMARSVTTQMTIDVLNAVRRSLRPAAAVVSMVSRQTLVFNSLLLSASPLQLHS